MTKSNDVPTPEMVAFYELRTSEHIERVRKCLRLIADSTDYPSELRQRAVDHDASKYGEAERLPYIWLTEYHRCRRAGEPFEYPPGMEQRVRDAIKHHVTTNRHHAEFYNDPNMVDLIWSSSLLLMMLVLALNMIARTIIARRS